jgi:flavin-binding protein dodecin
MAHASEPGDRSRTPLPWPACGLGAGLYDLRTRGFARYLRGVVDNLTLARGRHGSGVRSSTGREAARNAELTARMDAVAVQKAVDLTGSGESIQDAVTEALDRARLTLEGITAFEVQSIDGTVDGSATAYRVQVRVWFTLLERMHG